MIFRAASWVRSRWRGSRRRTRGFGTAAERLPICLNCIHFRNDPADMEAALPGLASIATGRAALRAEDGLCVCHDRFVTTQSCCAKFRDRLNGSNPQPRDRA